MKFKEGEEYTNSIYIFNGDLYDDGEYDNLLGRLINDLKRANPDRFIDNQGNRDPNELRFGTELATIESIASCFLNKHTPSWAANENNYFRTYILEFLKDKIDDEKFNNLSSLDKNNPHDFETLINMLNKVPPALVDGAKNSLDAVRVIYCKWMIDKTMGSGNRGVIPSKFESRRTELLRERLLSASEIVMNENMFVKLCSAAGFHNEKILPKDVFKKIKSANLNDLASLEVMTCLRFLSSKQAQIKENDTFKQFYVSDADVMNDFKSSCERGGHVYERYVKGNFNIATLADDTLYVHGTINSNSMVVDGKDYTDKPIEQWISAINKSGRESVAKQLQDINTPNPADQLLPSIIKYGIQQFAIENGKIESSKGTIINNGAYDPKRTDIIKARLKDDGFGSTIGNFLGQPDNDFLEKLVDKGVKHIVCGHKPFANSSIPPRFNIPLNNVKSIEIVMLDVTYAKDQNQATAGVVQTKQENGSKLDSVAMHEKHGLVSVLEGGTWAPGTKWVKKEGPKSKNGVQEWISEQGGAGLGLDGHADVLIKPLGENSNVIPLRIENTTKAFQANDLNILRPEKEGLLSQPGRLKKFSRSPEGAKFPSVEELQAEIDKRAERKNKPS